MKLSRRSMLAALGFGAVATPVAAPMFGRAVASNAGRSVGAGALTGIIGGYGESDGPTPTLDPERTIFTKAKENLLKEFLGDLLTQQDDAEQRRRRFHEIAIDNYSALPSWSHSFRGYVIRKENDERQAACRSIREIIQDKMKEFAGLHGIMDDNGPTRLGNNNCAQAKSERNYR